VNIGKAVTIACGDAKKKIANKASITLKVDPGKIRIHGGRASAANDSSKSIAIRDLFIKPQLLGSYGPPVAVVEGKEFVGEATWVQKIATPDQETGRVVGGRLSPSYVNVAQAAEVLVNVETGQVKVKRIIAAQDVGKAINPQLVKWQIISCVMMGLSAALSEELVHSDGRLLNPNFADYKLLTAMDTPRIETILIETPDKDGPYGAKPVGEANILPVAAAIRNAVHDAVGVWIDDLPITSEKIRMTMKRSGN
jgi:CO/xanthine dehydrogenase Mo-binding subunit